MYFEGGAAASGQMVDQRFLQSLDEGEARFVMIVPVLNRVEHYVYIRRVGGETEAYNRQHKVAACFLWYVFLRPGLMYARKDLAPSQPFKG